MSDFFWSVKWSGMCVCLHTCLLARKKNCKNHFKKNAFSLFCLHFSFQPRSERSWAALAQVPHCEVRDQGLEEKIRWLSVTVMTASPSPPLLPLLFPHPFLASTSGTKKGKKQQYDKKQQLPLQTQAGGWVFIPSGLFVTLLPCSPQPWAKWRIFLESLITENGLEVYTLCDI